MTYDALVLGLGVMGSAAVEALARRGLTVAGIEQFGACHSLGSSHGETRIVRTLYCDHRYVPLADEALRGWRDLEARTGQTFFHEIGHLSVGPEGEHGTVSGLARSAVRHSVPFDLLDEAELASAFPTFRAPEGSIALFEPKAGFVTVEPVLRALHALARAASAQLTFDCAVSGFTVNGPDIEIRTSHGVVRARRLVITAGPWTSRLLGTLDLSLRVRGVSQAWYRWDASKAATAPCFTVETAQASAFFGIPHAANQTMKVGGPSHPIEFESCHREVPSSEQEKLDAFGARFCAVDGSDRLRATECLITQAPNERFTIDRDPRDARVVFAAGFSGHGFKFAPIVGRIIADLVEGRDHDAASRFLAHDSALFPPSRGQS